MVNVDLDKVLKHGKSLLSWLTDPKNIKYLAIVVVVAMGVGLVYQYNMLQEIRDREQQAISNVTALESRLEVERDKTGTLRGEKGALQVELNSLRELNSTLSDEVKDLRENPVTITKIRVVTERDTIVDIPTAGEYLGENRFKLSWNYEQSGDWGSRAIGGTNEFNVIGDEFLTDIQTDITTDSFSLNITTGFRETDEGMLRVYAQTDYPNVTFNQVEGAIVDPDYFAAPPPSKRPHWVVGPYFGVGMSGEYVLRPTIGVGITYNVFSWR